MGSVFVRLKDVLPTTARLKRGRRYNMLDVWSREERSQFITSLVVQDHRHILDVNGAVAVPRQESCTRNYGQFFKIPILAI